MEGYFGLTSTLRSFLFAEPTAWGEYGYVALRVVMAAFWLNSVIPRWVALVAGHPMANGFVRNLFGSSMVLPLTYFFTLLETLGAVSFILGLVVRLASIWAVIQFAIIGTSLVLAGNTAQSLVLALLLAASLVLLLNGSQKLSLDGLIAKRRTSR